MLDNLFQMKSVVATAYNLRLRRSDAEDQKLSDKSGNDVFTRWFVRRDGINAIRRRPRGGCRMAEMNFLVRWNRPGANWVVQVDDKHYGAYLTKEQALRDALDAAGEAQTNGHDAHVWDAAALVL